MCCIVNKYSELFSVCSKNEIPKLIGISQLFYKKKCQTLVMRWSILFFIWFLNQNTNLSFALAGDVRLGRKYLIIKFYKKGIWKQTAKNRLLGSHTIKLVSITGRRQFLNFSLAA